MIKKDSFLYEFLYNEAPMENPDVNNAQDNNPGGPGNGPQMPPMGGNDSQMPPMDNNNGGAPADAPQGPDAQMPPMGGEGAPGADAMPPMGDGAGATPEMPPMEPGLGGEAEGAGANDTVIDVDDLTQAQEKLNTKVNALGHNTSEMNGNLEKVIAMVTDLSNKLDASNREIEAFKADMERRNPTQKEKLELRTRVSAPFDVPVEQYWDDFEKTHPNYEVSDAQKNDKGQYVVTRADANDYDPYEMEQSLLGNPLFEEKTVREAIRRALRNNKKTLIETLNNQNYELYHCTSFENGVSIIFDNELNSSYHRGYTDNDKPHNGICFTRRKSYKVYDESCVQFVFHIQQLLKATRGCTLVPYQDYLWQGFGEAEERLISRDGRNFSISNLSQFVTAVNIYITDLVEYLVNLGAKADYATNDIIEIYKNPAYKGKVHLLWEMGDQDEISCDEAINYIEESLS